MNTKSLMTLMTSIAVLTSYQSIYCMKTYDNTEAKKALQKHGIDLDSIFRQIGHDPKSIKINCNSGLFVNYDGIAYHREQRIDAAFPSVDWHLNGSINNGKLSFDISIKKPEKSTSMITFILGHELAHLTPYNTLLCKTAQRLHTPNLLDIRGQTKVYSQSLSFWESCKIKLSFVLFRIAERHADLTAQKVSVNGGINFFKEVLKNNGETIDPIHPCLNDRIKCLEDAKMKYQPMVEQFEKMRFWLA